MRIVATLPGVNLFSSLPKTSPPKDPSATTSHTPPPPIPIPKYPPPLKSRKSQKTPPQPHKSPSAPQSPESNPAFKTFHQKSKYYKPVKDGQVIQSDGERSVVVGESGVSYRLPGAPFEFQFSYSETPKAKPLAIREPAFLPFAPPTMPRPWTGKAPMKKAKKNIPLFDSPLPIPPGTNGVKHLEMPGPYHLGKYRTEVKSRKEVLGKPLTRSEIRELLKPCVSSNRQVNLGRDGLTHNMLELIHMHWRRQPVCKVRCLGVPTVNMDNVCRCLEEKTLGKIIHRVGGVVYIFRGRNYDHRARPQYPVMLWKPATPVYPKLIQEAPEGLTKAEANELRSKGQNLLPICKLAKNGVYLSLVKDVRIAFEGCPLVKIDCTGLHPSDYKRLGAKLMELVPCVLLSFDEEQILMWRGKDWKSTYKLAPSSLNVEIDGSNSTKTKGTKTGISSPKMMSLWRRAIESSKALLLDEIGLGPDALLKKVEEFESVSQATVHSYPALILPNENVSGVSAEIAEEDSNNEVFNDDDDDYVNDPFEVMESSAPPPLGSLPVDFIANKFSED